MKIKATLISMLSVMALTSCLNDDKNQNEYSVAYNANYTYVTDTRTGVSSLNAPVTVDFNFDLVKKTLALNIAGLQLAKDNVVALSIPATPYTTDKGFFTINIDKLDLGSHVVRDLTVNYLDGQYTWSDYAQIIDMSFRVDDYRVTVFEKERFFAGTTTVSPIKGAGDDYVNSTMYYKVKLNDDKTTASVTIYNVKFAEMMPAQTSITLPNVNFIPKQGGYTLQADAITPTLDNGSPKPEYAITDFNAVWDIDSDMNMTYNVMGAFAVKATLK